MLPAWAWLLTIPALAADVQPWGLQSIRQTGISLTGVVQAVLDANGNIYLAGFPRSTAVSKVDPTGHMLFTISLGMICSLFCSVPTGIFT